MRTLTTMTLSFMLSRLRAGEELVFSGTLYTMRDQAHKRLIEDIQKKKRLPFDTHGAVIYYCGPTKTPAGKTVGSCGPTTSSRMDAFTPPLLRRGVKAMIGKGGRSTRVIEAMRRFKAVYFLAPAGCGALLAQKVRKVTQVAYADLGPEAIYRYEVKDFPLIVAIDASGRSVYGSK